LMKRHQAEDVSLWEQKKKSINVRQAAGADGEIIILKKTQ
jgi:hypothetical protein